MNSDLKFLLNTYNSIKRSNQKIHNIYNVNQPRLEKLNCE